MTEIALTLRLDNIPETARDFLNSVGDYKKFAFYGQMGAGKTTFISAICHELKALDLVSSPTFSIVNEYQTASGDLIYHFDFYRINRVEELYDIGFEEYTDTGAWCFIEWPEKGEAVIPEDFLQVNILATESGDRKVIYRI